MWSVAYEGLAEVHPVAFTEEELDVQVCCRLFADSRWRRVSVLRAVQARIRAKLLLTQALLPLRMF